MIFAIDTETTGLHASRHECIEIALVGLNSDLSLNGHEYVSRIRPSEMGFKLMQPEAFNVNKITKEELMVAPNAAQVRRSLLEWKSEITGEKIEPLGHNYLFDKGFIANFLGEDLYSEMFDYHVRDSCILAQCLKDIGYKLPIGLKKLAVHFGISTEALHSARGDALLTVEVYKRLVGLIKLV